MPNNTAEIQAREDLWVAPPRPDTEAGEPRSVGVELEFGDLSVADAAEVVRGLWGGTVESRGDHDATVRGTGIGDVEVTLDTRLAKGGESETAKMIRSAFGHAAGAIVPVEITCPPIPWSRGAEIEALCDALRRAEASGSLAAPLYAFGTHLNVELPDLRPETIRDGVRAFAILFPWLRKRGEIDPARRIASFAKPFPDDYADLILAPCYAPDVEELTRDYLDANATRNRALDVLPIFAELLPETIENRLPDEKIGARPTWHYRLPNSEIDDPDWRLGREWARWVAVERLAEDGDRLADAAKRVRGATRRDAEAIACEIGDELCPAR